MRRGAVVGRRSEARVGAHISSHMCLCVRTILESVCWYTIYIYMYKAHSTVLVHTALKSISMPSVCNLHRISATRRAVQSQVKHYTYALNVKIFNLDKYGGKNHDFTSIF